MGQRIVHTLLSGGATSGTGSTPGTALDLVWAAGSAASKDRTGDGDDILVLDASPYTMTFANRFRWMSNTGKPGRPVRLFAADADGVPHDMGRSYGVTISAGNDRATWGSTHTQTPVMFTVDSVGGQGPGFPIQHWQITGFHLDGVSGIPYGAICNAGAGNLVFNNNHGIVSYNKLTNYYHTGISIYSNADQAGLVGAENDARVQCIGNICTAHTNSLAGTGINARNQMNARGGLVCLLNFIDGGTEKDLQSGIALGLASKNEVRGNTIRRCQVGIFGGTATDLHGTEITNNDFDDNVTAFTLADRNTLIRGNKIVGSLVAIQTGATDASLFRKVLDNVVLNCDVDMTDASEAVVAIARSLRALGAIPEPRRLRNRLN